MQMKFLQEKQVLAFVVTNILGRSTDKKVSICKTSFPKTSLLCWCTRIQVPHPPKPAQVNLCIQPPVRVWLEKHARLKSYI